MSTSRLSFGVKTSQVNSTYSEILEIWREVDRTEAFDHAWLWDHMVPLRGDVTQPALEAWTLLAALAAQTERIHLGVSVTSNRLREPAVLAKMAATVDQISTGRLVFGIGAGGHAVSDPAGMALVEERVRRLWHRYRLGARCRGRAWRGHDDHSTPVERIRAF